ncbi:MAG: glucose-6-phosphate isomerase [Pseudomonadota bacterium]
MTTELRHKLPSWQQLRHHEAPRWQSLHLRDVWHGDTGATRIAALVRKHDGLRLDFSKQRLDATTLAHLLQLADEVDLSGAIAGLLRGDPVNTTEHRPALHTALRLPASASLPVAGEDVVPAIHQSLARVRDMVQRIHAKQWRGVTGEAMTDVVCIGVGGSDLGPHLVTNALAEFAVPEARGLRLHFVSSIDGTQIADLLHTLRQDTTLIIIASKSFTTIDTLSNAETALTWMLLRLPDRERVLRHHVIGVSARPEKMTAYGIPEANQVLLWDWVGGRFSLWSGIGLPIALKLGMSGFEQLLAGAHAMDEHFAKAPFADNLPVLMGLLMVWNSTFLGINGQAILPYDARLKVFPSYLTQLEMESNGKSVDRRGDPVPYDTCPILWGEVGSNAQHAFYQLLHQGTQAVASDFIVPILRYQRVDEAGLALQNQHLLSLANCFAQSQLLMLGDDEGEKHHYYHGNQPSSTLLLDSLTPYSLGQLIALYEHKVFVASVIWDINPFDQWGVELGKKIAATTHAALAAASPDLSGFDLSTGELLKAVRA